MIPLRRLITHILLILTLAPVCAGARAASQVQSYLAQRKHYKITGTADYAALRANIAGFSGRVVELKGIVSGIAQSSAGCTFILDLPQQGSVTVQTGLTSSPDLYTGNALRVLARVPEGAISLSSMDLVALVPEFAIAPYDPKPKPKPAVVARTPADPPVTQAAPGAGSRVQRGDVVTARGAAGVLEAYRRVVQYFNRRLSKEQAETIARHVLNYSYYNGVDARLVMAVIAVESGFNPTATSRVGAMGLGQLMPGTARGLGVTNAYNTEENLAGATRLIRGHLEQFEGKPVWEQIALAMACYNAGPGAVKKYGGVPPYRETQNYVRKVASLYKRFLGVN